MRRQTKKADSTTLGATKQACDTKSREWEERSKTRKGELEAIAMAVKIVGKVSGVRTKAPSNPVMRGSPLKFLQVDNTPLGPFGAARAVQLLRATAKTEHSKSLERLALEVSTHLTGHFDRVNGFIQKMIFRLMAEQTDEDKHKAWCDLELAKTKQSMSDKSSKIKNLGANVAEANAGVAKLTGDITDADKMVANINSFMQEATEIRTAGKNENKVAMKDAKSAQSALANAIAVLEDFYKKSGETKFVQVSGLPKDPKLWDSSYTGVADPKKANTGIIAILSKISAGFSKMEAETRAQEITDQKKYDDQMKAHKIEKARRLQESSAKLQAKKRKILKVQSMNYQKKHTSEELDAVKQYNKDLKPACVSGGSTYSARKDSRYKEMQALKQAQGLLKDAFKKKGAAFLEVRRHEQIA